MARAELTPLEIKYKQIISSKLNELLNLKNTKKIEINKATGIPSSTLTDYFKGRSLPSPENVEKLAAFFNVDKSEIDPRFKVSNEEKSDNTALTWDDLGVPMPYGGNIPDELKETYSDLAKSYFKRHPELLNKDDK